MSPFLPFHFFVILPFDAPQVILLQNKCGVACRCKPALAEIFLGASLQAYFCRPICRKAIPPHSGGRKITYKSHRNMADSRGKNKICQI